MTTIQLRIDEETKNKAKKTLDKLGLDMSSAIKLFLKQVVIQKGIPFDLITENGMTVAQELKILKAAEDAKKGINVSRTFDSAEEMIKELNKK